jgi:hypothetical protein
MGESTKWDQQNKTKRDRQIGTQPQVQQSESKKNQEGGTQQSETKGNRQRGAEWNQQSKQTVQPSGTNKVNPS